MIPQDLPARRETRFLPGTAIPHPARRASRRRRSAQSSHFLRSLLGREGVVDPFPQETPWHRPGFWPPKATYGHLWPLRGRYGSRAPDCAMPRANPARMTVSMPLPTKSTQLPSSSRITALDTRRSPRSGSDAGSSCPPALRLPLHPRFQRRARFLVAHEQVLDALAFGGEAGAAVEAVQGTVEVPVRPA